MHHANYFWVNLGTAYMGQWISTTDTAFWVTPTIPPSSCVLTKLVAPSSSNKHINTFEYCVHWNINIWKNIFTRKINVGWNKHSAEQH